MSYVYVLASQLQKHLVNHAFSAWRFYYTFTLLIANKINAGYRHQ
jgi:hypothetical protein